MFKILIEGLMKLRPSKPKSSQFKKIWNPTPKSGGDVIHVTSTKTQEEFEARVAYFISLGINAQYAYIWACRWAGRDPSPKPEQG